MTELLVDFIGALVEIFVTVVHGATKKKSVSKSE